MNISQAIKSIELTIDLFEDDEEIQEHRGIIDFIKSQQQEIEDYKSVVENLTKIINMGHRVVPIALNTFQEKWVEDKSPLKIWEKSRRIGATEAEAYNSVMEISEKKSTAYISYDEESIKHFLAQCKEWSVRMNMPCSEIQTEPFRLGYVFSLYFTNGFQVVGFEPTMGYNTYNCNRVIIDELAFVDKIHDRPISEFIDYLLDLKDNRQISVISSHNGENNYFNELIRKEGWSKHKTTMDDAIKDGGMSEGIFKQIKEQLDEDTFNQEYLCIPKKDSK